MIIDKDTNVVYLSRRLETDPRFPGACALLTSILDKHKVSYDFLEGTKDIWARDYMPIQKGKNSFVQFKYEPSYLKNDPDIQSDTKEVCSKNNIKPTFSKIKLDGGNIIKWHDKVIISKRIFSENLDYEGKKLIDKIEELLDVRVILIPDIDPLYDMTGHADGYVRFLNDKTVLVNELENEFKYWKSGFKTTMNYFGLDYIEIPWFEKKDKKHPNSALGIYINYLEIGNLIIMPIFHVQGNKDQKVYDLFIDIFKDKIIETININSIGLWGGLMNCITWTIKS